MVNWIVNVFFLYIVVFDEVKVGVLCLVRVVVIVVVFLGLNLDGCFLWFGVEWDFILCLIWDLCLVEVLV